MSTSNFSDIQTPGDLARANNTVEEPTAADKLMEKVLELDPSVGHELATRILGALRELHYVGSEQYKEEGDIDAACVWRADAARLDNCLEILKEVVL